MHQRIKKTEAREPKKLPTSKPRDHMRHKHKQEAVRNRYMEAWIPIARHPHVVDHRIVES